MELFCWFNIEERMNLHYFLVEFLCCHLFPPKKSSLMKIHYPLPSSTSSPLSSTAIIIDPFLRLKFILLIYSFDIMLSQHYYYYLLYERVSERVIFSSETTSLSSLRLSSSNIDALREGRGEVWGVRIKRKSHKFL
jgi:hypothetical protein